MKKPSTESKEELVPKAPEEKKFTRWTKKNKKKVRFCEKHKPECECCETANGPNNKIKDNKVLVN
eukprot:8030530-Karenia_brevis.AAC.1